MKKAFTLGFSIVLFMFAIGAYLYPQLPDEVPTHWNDAGEVDGYMPKFWGIFLLPIMTFAILLMFMVIPRVDPKKINLEKFMSYYEGMVIVFTGFMFYIFTLILMFSMGYVFNMFYAILPGMGFLFIYIGFMLERAKQNWFVGIRTPWTLSSERVWDKTHKLGGKLFKIAGALTVLSIFVIEYAFWILMISILGVSFYLIVYSYFEYQKEVRKKK